MLSYTLQICLNLLNSRKLRNRVGFPLVSHTCDPALHTPHPRPAQVLTLLAELHRSTDKPDYFAVTQSYIFLDQPQNMADILVQLAKGTEVRGVRGTAHWWVGVTPPPGGCRRMPLWPTRSVLICMTEQRSTSCGVSRTACGLCCRSRGAGTSQRGRGRGGCAATHQQGRAS